MDTYTAIVTLESSDTEDGVDVKWYSGHDPLKALLAVGQCIEHHVNPGTHPHPVRMMGVRIEVTVEPDPPVTYWCTHCGMRTETDDLTVIGRNCSYSAFEKPHNMVPLGTYPTSQEG